MLGFVCYSQKVKMLGNFLCLTKVPFIRGQNFYFTFLVLSAILLKTYCCQTLHFIFSNMSLF